jgi:hypothetical protein
MPTSERTPGREPIVIVRLDQPACEHAFGVAPCLATGEPCYNTRASCKDPANYSQTDASVIPIFFGRPQTGGPADVPYLLPFLESVSEAGEKINLSGADKNSHPLGNLAMAKLVFTDQPHSDRLVDPYVESRATPAFSRGSFWSRWNARNRYGKFGALVTIYHGYAGQALADMFSRTYIAEKLEFTGGPRVTLTCRDMLAKLSNERAQIPEQSPGELYADIDATQLSIEIARAVLSDYASSGTLCIGRECMTYSAVAENALGRLDFTLTARGTDGTTASAHRAEDQVQECFRFDKVTVDAGLAAVINGFTSIGAELCDLAGWAAERGSFLSSYLLDGLITKATPVKQVVGEILEQSQIILRWDAANRLVRMRAVRAITDEPRVLDEERHILAGSLKITEKPKERVSRIWVHFDQRDPTGDLGKTENYRRVQSSINLEKEAPELYGEKAVRHIYARFFRTRSVALQTTSRILRRYGEIPVEVAFALDAKDRSVEIGEIVYLDHHMISDLDGNYERRPWIITSVFHDVPGERLQVTAEDASLAGRVVVIMANGSPDYQGDGSDQFNGAWICGPDGNYSNGDPGGRIQ